jgi:nucleoside-diphosphate-sugar epimerase
MKRAIVTGANGFIGSAVVRELAARGTEVFAIHRPGNCGNIPKSPLVKPIPLELENITKRSLARLGADVFYHFAWSGAYASARTDAALQLKNVQFTIDCLRVSAEMDCSRFVYAGSIMEYEVISVLNTPGCRLNSAHIYGSAKLSAHAMCVSLAADIGVELIIPIITNAYGAGELSARFINATIRKIIEGKELRFTPGTQNYDFVYITDVARALCLIGMNGKPFQEYIIGSSGAKPLREFILEIQHVLAPDREFIFGDIPFTGIDLPLETFDCSRTEIDTGFKTEISFADGLRQTMNWLMEMRK